jgi:membrane-associated phospholipid phosphatase
LKICSIAGVGALTAALLFTSSTRAGGGLLGIDHLVTLDDHGIWARNNQLLLFDAMLVGEGAIALWEGNDTRLGHTMWQSIDATMVAGVAAQGMKMAFSRSRPNQSPDPDLWFQGSGHNSFPSGEVTVISAIITPILLEYRHDQPWVYALEVLPMYDAIARVKVHGHWQSDVLAGYALGTAAGFYMHQRQNTPLVLSVLPHGFYVCFKKSFN